MKPGAAFRLNPYADLYIPQSTKGADDKTYVTDNDSKRFDGPIVKDPNVPTSQNISAFEAPHLKSQPACSSHGSRTQSAFHMDTDYLRESFPGISDQSLADVYILNGFDLDATIDMLTQLELSDVDSSEGLTETTDIGEGLTETQDIGDVSESGSLADAASLKLKNVAADAGTSSNPSASANVSEINNSHCVD